jgi:4'-phosphopantetheinyl transferase
MGALSLADGEIDVWISELDTLAPRFDELQAVLSTDELARASRLHFDRDRCRFICARAILRILLGRYTGWDPRALRFEYGTRGKPRLANATLSFNLAHSGELAVYGLARNARMGVDIEACRPIPEMREVIARCFSLVERRAWESLPVSQREEAFFACWTRKEAYLKAIGDGLWTPLHSFDVNLVPGETPSVVAIEGSCTAAARWQLFELHTAPGYVGAVAVEGAGWSMRVRCEP